MTFFKLYWRALSLLKTEQRPVLLLALAGGFLGIFQLAQVLLFANFVEALARLQPVAATLVVWAVLGLIAVAASLWLASQAEKLAHRFRFKLMGDFTENVVARAPAHLSASESKKQTEGMMAILLRGADQLFFIWLNVFRDHFSAAISLLAAIAAALYISWPVALLLLAMTALFVMLHIVLTRRAFDEQMKFEKFHGHIAERASDVMGNAAVIQSYTRLSAEIGGLHEAMHHVLSAQFPALNWWARKSALVRSAGAVFVVLTLSFASYFYSEGQLDLSDIIILAGLSMVVLMRAEEISGFCTSLVFNKDSLKDLFTVFDMDAAVKDDGAAEPLRTETFKIDFKAVRFGEDEAITLSIQPNETVAFFDKSGTTAAALAAALMRMRMADSGKILIGGQDISKVSLASLRKNISYIPHNAGLLHRPVIENLTLGKPNASQEEIIEAVQRAEAHDFIAAKRDGFHTVVSERAKNFSADERRQILIARAFLKNASLVIYEDSENPADVPNKKLVRAFDNLRKDRAVIILTRNAAMLDKAKRVFVFEDGKLVPDEKSSAAPDTPPVKKTRAKTKPAQDK